MSDQFVAVTNKGAYKYSVNNGSLFSSKLGSGDFEDTAEIKCVAVGKNKRYAIVGTGGAYSVTGPQRLLDKMSELHGEDETQNIKHISFGPRDCYAITMDRGWCYGWMPESVLNVVNEHNGNITYVSMTSSDDQWIVGWANNGWKGKVCDKLSGYLSGINSCKKEIKLVELGYNNHWFVHSDGQFRYATNFNSWLKDVSASRIAIGLW